MLIMKRILAFTLMCVVAAPVLATDQDPAKPAPLAKKISYSRDILPILSGNCFLCHGPDPEDRKAKLRLDLSEEATKKLRSGYTAVVPGKADESELIARIFTSEETERMPPPGHAKALSDTDKPLLQDWIAQGAIYEKHWAFAVPTRPALPTVKSTGWARNPIDLFLLAKMEANGYAPAPEADRYTLARRVAIDLTGLPPTLDVVDRFVKDTRPDAYERYVDEIMASPAFGERWAAVWLDLARYADSNGYADDRPRVIWKYRDWVIQSINKNMPFDQFTVEQLAGDLLPNPTEDQLIATAFHRNTLNNSEGGTDDEEFRTAAVVDRVNTTMQVWMGLTMGCAQCHNHKYDPLSQEEYFKFFAIFNNTEDADTNDLRPTLVNYTEAEKKKYAQYERQVKELEGTLAKIRDAKKRYEDERKKAEELKKKMADEEKKKKAEPEKKKSEPKTSAFDPDPDLAFVSAAADVADFLPVNLPNEKKLQADITALRKKMDALGVRTPIMKELPKDKQRKTFIQIRGNFLDKGDQVGPGVPTVFHSLPEEKPIDRLALAHWLLDAENPLAARVAVNRHWEQIFGRGLVETSEDFGLRGSQPTHPELLDWLAVEFREKGWDVKRMLKMIVTSSAYRQSSKLTPALLERDPDNLFYARGPRFRSSAEVIRDQALFVSGLLSPKMYGPSVNPPRPSFGLSAAFGGTTDWQTSYGDDKYRRAVYTQWRRSMPYPSMTTFDAPNRNVCTILRPRTNTPLQALVTLNDPVYVEAAQALGRKMLKEGGATVAEKAAYGFRLCLIRPPSQKELDRLVSLYENARQKYAGDLKNAEQLATNPLGPLPPGVDAADAAAWTLVGNVLLNLDETFMKR
jgi:hypothetical protein